MAQTPRERAREETMTRIIELGRKQLANGGVEALNLRAIARELGIVSSGIYRYVADRAQLITLLIVDAFDELDNAVAQRDDARAQPRERFVEVVSAMRQWALEFPQRWGLIYGTPIVGYQAPAAETMAAGTKVSRRLATLLEQSTVASLGQRSPQLDADMEAATEDMGSDLSADAMEMALEAWVRIIGLINAEVFGYLGRDTLSEFAEFHARSVSRLADELGL
ncbi:TetR/AcrR family transcriptional regulator [Corynebacterium accolens]|uniref:TetR/AcrR family transcriptional regulator n=1 Tax=Corynebacterium accolens TaxID=38284 RepID=UPI002543FAC9|nr:TetR/AcrR family transcriptional regulator [Corynebacterium accolens]MDK4275488.1 TetR/AcrR family transcriptional regulator [Corynebacterium accolens]